MLTIVLYVISGLEIFLLLKLILCFMEEETSFKLSLTHLECSGLSIFIMLVMNRLVERVLWLERLDRYFIYLILFLLIFVTGMTYLVFELFHRLYRRNLEKKQLEEALRMKDKYYEAIENDQIEVRTIRHNLKNQLIIVQKELQEQKWLEAENAVNSLIGHIVSTEKYQFTKHIGINVVLNEKMKEAHKYDIECQFDVQVPETVQIGAQDLGILLGNPLDNAIEACQRIHTEEKKITLKLVYYKQTLVLSIINSAENVENLLTKKQDKKNHGLGIRSVEKVVKKYNGTMDIFMESQFFRMDISLLNV